MTYTLLENTLTTVRKHWRRSEL